MKELFNILSNVSNFFNEKRFVYQYETPKAPEAPKSPSETRVEQAKLQDKYLQPQENIVSEEGHKLEPRAGVKYKLMRVRENVGKIPSCDQLFGVEVPVFTINDKTYALRDKNGKYYDAATKKPIDLQPKDNLEFPTNPESYQRMKLLASIAEGKAVRGQTLPPMDLGPEPKPEERVDEGAIARQRRGELEETARRMPGVPPSKPEPPVREAVAARPKIRKVRESLTIEFNDRNTKVATEEEIKDTKKYPYVVIYRYKTEQIEPTTKKEIPIETIAVRNTPQGFMDANGNWVTPEGEYRILIPLDNADGRTIATYLETKATGVAEAKPEAPTMVAGRMKKPKEIYADLRPTKRRIRTERDQRRRSGF